MTKNLNRLVCAAALLLGSCTRPSEPAPLLRGSEGVEKPFAELPERWVCKDKDGVQQGLTVKTLGPGRSQHEWFDENNQVFLVQEWTREADGTAVVQFLPPPSGWDPDAPQIMRQPARARIVREGTLVTREMWIGRYQVTERFDFKGTDRFSYNMHFKGIPPAEVDCQLEVKASR